MWKEDEVNFIKDYKGLVNDRNYLGILSIDKKRIGQKICLLLSLISDDEVNIECNPTLRDEWELIISFKDGAFFTISHLENLSSEISIMIREIKEFLKIYLEEVIGINSDLSEKLVNFCKVRG